MTLVKVGPSELPVASWQQRSQFVLFGGSHTPRVATIPRVQTLKTETWIRCERKGRLPSRFKGWVQPHVTVRPAELPAVNYSKPRE
jgi:hypothetical protein